MADTLVTVSDSMANRKQDCTNCNNDNYDNKQNLQ